MMMMTMMIAQKSQPLLVVLLFAAFFFLTPSRMALASELVPLGVIEVSMASTSTSNPESFPIQVLSQTVQFLGDVFRKEYGSAFQRVSLSIHSRGIHAAEDDEDQQQGSSTASGYVAAMKLTGTAYFRDGMTPASLIAAAAEHEEEESDSNSTTSTNTTTTNRTVADEVEEEVKEIQQIHDVLTTAFEDQNQDFIVALSQSHDPFLSNITYAVVSVNDEDDIEVMPKTVEKDSDSDSSSSSIDNISEESIDTWLIAVIAGVTGFLGVLCLCLLCVCCWGGDGGDGTNSKQEKEPMNLPHGAIPKAESGNTKANSDLEDLYIGTGTGDDDDNSVASTMDVGGGLGTGGSKITALDVHSIMSQNSSQFTYNPSSLRSTDAHTVASFITQDGNIEINLEEWQKAAVVDDNDDAVAVPLGVGRDISAIEHKKDLSLIVEGESESPTPLKKGRGGGHNNSAGGGDHNNSSSYSQNRSQSLPAPRGGGGSRYSSTTYLSSQSIQDLELAELRAQASRGRSSYHHHHHSKSSSRDLDLSRGAQNVIDDLNDLSLQVAAFRRSNSSRPSM